MVDSMPFHVVGARLLGAAGMLEVRDVFAGLLLDVYFALSQRVLDGS